MDNILESMKILSKNEDIKKNFISEFNEQVNSLNEGDEKWGNYKTFIQENSLMELFFNEFDFKFIQKQIIGYLNTSNINIDNINNNNIFYDLDKIFFKRAIIGFTEDELKVGKELVNTFGNLIRINFHNTVYNKGQLLYISLENNIVILKIVFYIVLINLGSKQLENYKDIKIELNGFLNNEIYQYISFKQNNEKFGKQLLIVSFIALFIEEKDRQFTLKQPNNTASTYYLRQIFDLVLDIEEDSYIEILLDIEKFNLLYNLLYILESSSNSWINKDYIVKILSYLFKIQLIDIEKSINFSELFLEYDEVKENYLNYIKLKEFDEHTILEGLENAISDTFTFLLIEGNKKYITELIKRKIVDILKEELLKNITLSKNFYLMYEYILDENFHLELGLIDFNYDFIEEFIKDKDGLLFTLKNIGKVIVKKDLTNFYYSLINKYIENIDKGEIFSIKDIREEFGFDDKIIKDVLQKIKKEGNLINGASGFGRYKVIGE